jgi:hypothetical protein
MVEWSIFSKFLKIKFNDFFLNPTNRLFLTLQPEVSESSGDVFSAFTSFQKLNQAFNKKCKFYDFIILNFIPKE